nr:hypothetical protein [Tanacetum cinerariifolium]
ESDNDADDQDEAGKVNDDDDDEEEITKIGEQAVTESDEGDDEATESDRESEDEETREQEEESFDLIPRTPEDNEDDDNNKEDQGLRIGEEERMQEEEDVELYCDSDAQQESSSTSSFMTNLLNPITDPGMESIFMTGSTTITLIPSPQSTMTPSIISTFTSASQLPTPPTQIPSLDLQSLPTFVSVFRFEDRVKSLEDNFSNIPGIVNQYMYQQMPKAIREAVQTQTNRLQDSIQRENDEFLKTINENMKKIIKEQILIDKIEGNKSIQRSDEQRNLYKALVEAYDADKTILDIYEESTILKQRREDDDQEGPSTGSDQGSKRQREGGEHASASTSSEPATRSTSRSTTGSQSRQLSASESAFTEEPVQATCQMEEPSHPVFETGAEDQPIIQTTQHPEWFSQPRRPPTPDRDWNKSVPAAQGNAQSWISALAKQTNACSSFNELLDTPIDFSNFIMNRLGIDTLTLELLAGPTYELMRGSCNSLTKLEYHLEEVYKATTDQLDWVNPEDYGHIKWIEDLVPCAMWIQEPMSYDKDALWGVSHWGRKRKLSNLTVEERFAFNVSLRMFTRSIIIQRRVEDLQLGVESYQKRLNLTKPDTYRSDL